MSRTVAVLDRVLALLVGLVLIAAGAAAVVWWMGTFASWPHTLHTGPVQGWTRQTWWPWAVGAAGVVLILAALRWLVAHLPSRGISQVTLPGSNQHGRLHARVRPVTATAADLLATTDGVRSARGTIRHDRGQLFARLNATIEPHADLAVVAAAADRVSGDLRAVLQREDLHCQVNLTVARRAHPASRVDQPPP